MVELRWSWVQVWRSWAQIQFQKVFFWIKTTYWALYGKSREEQSLSDNWIHATIINQNESTSHLWIAIL